VLPRKGRKEERLRKEGGNWEKGRCKVGVKE